MHQNIEDRKPEGTYENPIVVSKMSREEAVLSVKKVDSSIEVNEKILERQEIVKVKYLHKDGKVYQGEIVADIKLKTDIEELFKYIEKINKEARLEEKKFYIDKILPIARYNWNDNSSMEDNNTSAFNYRVIKDTEGNDTDILSLHSFGFALDINPRENPVMVNGVVVQPKNGHTKEDKTPNTLTPEHNIVMFLQNRGFEWGGSWKNDYQDNHHFEKVLPTDEYIAYYIQNVARNPKITSTNVIERIEKLIKNRTGEDLDNLLKLVTDENVLHKIGERQQERLISLFNQVL